MCLKNNFLRKMGNAEIELFNSFRSLNEKEVYSNEIALKLQFLRKLKNILGEDCVIRDFTKIYGEWHSFRKPNIVHIKSRGIEIILFFHMSTSHSRKNKGFYGFSKEHTENILNYIRANSDKKIYFYLYLMLDTGETTLNFALPIFLIKNNENDISISEEGQYKLNIINKKNKYYLRLKNTPNEDLFMFMKDLNQIFD